MKRMSIGVLSLALLTAPAFADSRVEATYEATPDQLFEMVDFHKPSENVMPPVESSKREGEGVGATKINTLSGGGEVSLLLVYYEPSQRAFNYTITGGPLPVENYVGQVRVTDAGDDRARLSWQGTYDAAGVSDEKADEILGGFYAAIAERIGDTYPRFD